jgi:hypothetical protein
MLAGVQGGSQGCEKNAHFARDAAEAYTFNIELRGAGSSLCRKSDFVDGRLFRRHRNQVGVFSQPKHPPFELGTTLNTQYKHTRFVLLLLC